MLGNSSTRYGTVAMALHWLIALSIIGLLVVGKIMVDLPNDDPNKFFLYMMHKSTGFLVLALTFARIAWRFANPPPALPPGMAVWERWTASITHAIFYFMMLAIPLTGWVIVSTSSSGLATMWYGLFEIPHLPGLQTITDRREVHKEFEEIHEILGNLTILLLLLHVGAALKHHFWDRDSVLSRMLPLFGNPEKSAS
jgi:cytochrome b561